MGGTISLFPEQPRSYQVSIDSPGPEPAKYLPNIDLRSVGKYQIIKSKRKFKSFCEEDEPELEKVVSSAELVSYQYVFQLLFFQLL